MNILNEKKNIYIYIYVYILVYIFALNKFHIINPNSAKFNKYTVCTIQLIQLHKKSIIAYYYSVFSAFFLGVFEGDLHTILWSVHKRDTLICFLTNVCAVCFRLRSRHMARNVLCYLRNYIIRGTYRKL